MPIPIFLPDPLQNRAEGFARSPGTTALLIFRGSKPYQILDLLLVWKNQQLGGVDIFATKPSFEGAQ